MLKVKINALVLPIIFVSNVSAVTIYRGVATINTNTHPGFDFIQQIACSTGTSSSVCDQNFDMFNGLQAISDIESNGGYGVKMGQVNLDSLKTAPVDSVFALSPDWIDQIPFDSLLSRVGCTYWIKTGPDNGSIFYAKIRIISFPIRDSITPETAMKFLYALNAAGQRTCATSGLDTFHYSQSGVLSPGVSPERKTTEFSSPGQLIFKAAGNKFILPKELEGTSGFLSIFSLIGRRLGRVAFDGNTREINLSGAGWASDGAAVVRVENFH